MKFRGKICVLTGGRRLGITVAKTLVEKGVNFILSYRNSKKNAEKTANDLKKLGGKAFAIKADVTKENEVKKLFQFAMKKFGRVDILIHMVSSFDRTPWKKLNGKIWDREMANNLKSAFLCSKVAGDLMQKQKTKGQSKILPSGKIILFGDTAVFRPYAGRLPNLTAKAGIHALTQILATELAPKILVNCIAPGMILPEQESPKELKKILAKSLLKKTGTPQDIANAVLFLIKNDYMTGQVLKVDGGRL